MMRIITIVFEDGNVRKFPEDGEWMHYYWLSEEANWSIVDRVIVC